MPLGYDENGAIIENEAYCRLKTAKDDYSPVVLYARESDHEGADELLERQKEKLKDFCAEKGYYIADEVATIGSREDSIPALKKAIECADDEQKNIISHYSRCHCRNWRDITQH